MVQIKRKPVPAADVRGGGSPHVDVAALGSQLLGRWADIRIASRALAADPAMQGVLGLSKEEHRERALGQLKYLVKNGQVKLAFPAEYGGLADHGGNLQIPLEVMLDEIVGPELGVD